MTLANSNIPPGSSIIFRIPARLVDARLLGFSVNALFVNLGFNEVETYQLELALIESANNIIEHAGLEKGTAQISMKFTVMNDKVVCTFVDKGTPIDFLLNHSPTDLCGHIEKLPVSKRGLCIVCEVMDEVQYTRSKGKNILNLVKYLPG